MKQFLTSVLSLALCATVHAQQANPLQHTASPHTHRAYQEAMTAYNQAHTAAKPTGPSQRVSAWAGRIDQTLTGLPTHLTDTTTLFYSGDRHSAFFAQNVLYNINDADGWYFLDGVNNLYAGSRLDADVLKFYGWDTVTNSYKPAGDKSLTYGADDEVLTSYLTAADPTSGAVIYSAGFLYEYYPDGKYKTIYQLAVGAGGTFDTTSRKVYYYNTAGRVLLDTLYAYTSPGIWEYSGHNQRQFDGTGKLLAINEYTWDGSAPALTWKDTFDYYPSGMVRQQGLFADLMHTGTLSILNVDSFGYTTGVPGFTYDLQRKPDSSGHLDSVSLLTYQVTGGMIDSMFQMNKQWGPWDNFLRAGIVYNNSDNPVTSRGQVWDGAAWHPYYDYTFYYEDYTGIAATPTVNQLALFPNPASQQLNLQWHQGTAATDLTIDILNAAGALVARYQLPARDLITLPVSGLVTGTYFAQCRNKQGAVMQERFVKQ